MVLFDASAQAVDVAGSAEAVHHQVTAGRGKASGGGQPQTAHRAGNQRALAAQRRTCRVVCRRTRSVM
jgi:hypothetical protein